MKLSDVKIKIKANMEHFLILIYRAGKVEKLMKITACLWKV